MGRLIDLIGQKFGKLTPIKVLEKRNKGRAVWRCQCECGRYTDVQCALLISGGTKSCGSHRCRPNFKDLSGKKFEMLTVMKISEKTGQKGSAYWECICECGKNIVTLGASLSCGKTRSCGCLKYKKQYETIKNIAYAVHLTHATERGIINELSHIQYVEIASMPCHYCGDTDIKKNNRTQNSALAQFQTT